MTKFLLIRNGSKKEFDNMAALDKFLEAMRYREESTQKLRDKVYERDMLERQYKDKQDAQKREYSTQGFQFEDAWLRDYKNHRDNAPEVIGMHKAKAQQFAQDLNLAPVDYQDPTMNVAIADFGELVKNLSVAPNEQSGQALLLGWIAKAKKEYSKVIPDLMVNLRSTKLASTGSAGLTANPTTKPAEPATSQIPEQYAGNNPGRVKVGAGQTEDSFLPRLPNITQTTQAEIEQAPAAQSFDEMMQAVGSLYIPKGLTRAEKIKLANSFNTTGNYAAANFMLKELEQDTLGADTPDALPRIPEDFVNPKTQIQVNTQQQAALTSAEKRGNTQLIWSLGKKFNMTEEQIKPYLSNAVGIRDQKHLKMLGEITNNASVAGYEATVVAIKNYAQQTGIDKMHPEWVTQHIAAAKQKAILAGQKVQSGDLTIAQKQKNLTKPTGTGRGSGSGGKGKSKKTGAFNFKGTRLEASGLTKVAAKYGITREDYETFPQGTVKMLQRWVDSGKVTTTGNAKYIGSNSNIKSETERFKTRALLARKARSKSDPEAGRITAQIVYNNMYPKNKDNAFTGKQNKK